MSLASNNILQNRNDNDMNRPSTTPDDDDDDKRALLLSPSAQPPASAPPPPPPPGVSSYQHGSAVVGNNNQRHQQEQQDDNKSVATTGSGRAAAQPAIRHYYYDDQVDTEIFHTGTTIQPSAASQSQAQATSNNTQQQHFYHGTGDATLRPNVGLTNSYDHALFGLALHELLEYSRQANIIAAGFCIVFQAASWIFRLLFFRWDTLVLSGYLTLFSGMLLSAELLTLTRRRRLIYLQAAVQDNFGFLFHPVGKVAFMYLLATLCESLASRKSWTEIVLGLVYAANATVLLLAWIIYPEFRRYYSGSDPSVENNNNTRQQQQPTTFAASWSDYANSIVNMVSDSSEERASLLAVAQRESASS